MILAVLLFSGISIVHAGEPVHPGASAPVTVTIPSGAGTVAIGRLLVARGLVRNAYLFAAVATLSGSARRLEAGEYQLNAGMSLSRLVRHLASGDVVVVHVTIPPGFDVDQAIQRLVHAGLGSRAAFDAATRDWKLVEGLSPQRSGVRFPVEGFLYPDTYSFTHAMKPRQIIATMVARFRRVWTPAMSAAAAAEHMNVSQVVTLASIVEHEAQVAAERPIIAGVYMNRLRRHMYLDADPTVLYALRQPPDARLTLAQLHADSPYNTYARLGLPVGPIDNPGLASLQAALHPAKVPYLYFVSKGDGTLAFATTLTQQLANRKKYLGY